MMTPSKMTMAGVLTVLAAAPLVNAHGYMSVPKVTFAISGDPTQFCATMDGPTTLTAPSGMSFTTDPESNTKAFTAALKASTYTSVRALVDAKGVFATGMDKECGVTSPTGAAQPLPAKYVEWAHSSTEGFTPSHQGPCEVWCDDNKVFTDDNCAKNYPAAPALLPYDRTKCVGASMLKIYWLALHSSTWQAYINCAPLEGGSASAGSASAGSAETPSVTPAAASSASTGEDADDEYATPAPASSSAADDEYATPAPAASSDASAEEDCDDELDIADSASGSVGADEDCDDELDIADSASGSEDCDDELDIAGSDAEVGGDADVATPVTTAPSTSTKTPSTSTKTPSPSKTSKSPSPSKTSKSPSPSKTKKTPSPSKTKKTKTPSPTTATPSTSDSAYDDEYATPTPASEVGGDADYSDEVGADADSATGSDASGSEDCDDELDIADSASEDCDDELDIADSATGSVGADEDCDDELDIADSTSGSEDCDDELDIAGSEAVSTSDLDFNSISSADASEVGTVDAY